MTKFNLQGDWLSGTRQADGSFALKVDGLTEPSVGSISSANDMDINGNPVPTYKAHTYTYDGSGNVETDTVTDGTSTWVRTFMYSNGNLTTDSGWVKQ